MIGSVLTQLQTVMKDDTRGLNAEAANVESARSVTLPDTPDANIYALDAPVDLKTMNLPALVLTPARTASSEVRSQNIRDAVHVIGLEWATEEPDENEWREQAMYMAEAAMRVLDNFNANDSNYAGSSGVIVVEDIRVDYAVTWQRPPNAIRGFSMEADIFARDTFS